MKTIALLILSLSSPRVFAVLDTNRMEQITGLKGTWSAAEAVFKVTAARDDLPVPALSGSSTRRGENANDTNEP